MDLITAIFEEASSWNNILTSCSFIQQCNSLLDITWKYLMAKVPATVLMGHLDKGKGTCLWFTCLSEPLLKFLNVYSFLTGQDLDT